MLQNHFCIVYIDKKKTPTADFMPWVELFPVILKGKVICLQRPMYKSDYGVPRGATMRAIK